MPCSVTTRTPRNGGEDHLTAWLELLRHEAQAVPSEPEEGDGGPVLGSPRAAVVVLVIQGDEPGFLMTTRSATLQEHGGEVAFPGGRIEASDADPAAAALRELGEEVGLVSSRVWPLGYLPGIWTHGSRVRYWVTPLLAWLPGRFDFAQLNPGPEVEYAFSLPLAIGLDPGRYDRRRLPGTTHEVPVLHWSGPLIWGATARILMGCAQRIDTAARPQPG